MRISSFVNNPDETPLHDSGLAAKTAKEAAAMKPQSFEERQAIEKMRKIVGSYKDSFLGRPNATRKELGTYKKDSARSQITPPNRQEYNAGATSERPAPATPKRTFQEPPSRGYNPYG
jgi:hypothetical protein